ncbi:hypothetical protein BHE74_00015011 [Ensete ventricosum]|nr:hypothetical protein BHE74_00015011 [Ensete ventricosum]
MEAGTRGDEREMTVVAPGDGGGPERGITAAAGPSSELQVIRWERFLPRRSLRVLLVEHDDSTRHIVAALLRKCSYHVSAVADGLKAWAVLKLKCYRFDLVLTEVEMPSLSGIGLLSKIMAAEECKNIPVISNSGSKPEAQSKSVQKHMEILQSVEENRESEPKAEQPSDGTIIVANQLKNYKGHEARGYKTFEHTVQVNHSVQSTILAEQREDKNFLCNRSICKEEKQVLARFQKDEAYDPKPNHQPDATNESLQNMIEFIEPAMERAASREDIPCEASTFSHGKCTSDFGYSQLLELSLSRPQLNGCVNLEFKEKHVLNHSNASAFSRFGLSSFAPRSCINKIPFKKKRPMLREKDSSSLYTRPQALNAFPAPPHDTLNETPQRKETPRPGRSAAVCHQHPCVDNRAGRRPVHMMNPLFASYWFDRMDPTTILVLAANRNKSIPGEGASRRSAEMASPASTSPCFSLAAASVALLLL